MGTASLSGTSCKRSGGPFDGPRYGREGITGRNLFTKSAKGALTGGAMGGAAGFGAGGEGWDDRIKGATGGAKAGAITGAILPGAASAVGQTYRGIRTLTRAATAPLRSLADKETFAAGKVAEALKRDQMTPERLANRLTREQGYKPDLVAADVAGKNTQSLLRAANNVPSEARDKLTRSLFQRQEKQLDRLRGDIGAAYGSPEDFHKTVDQLTAGRNRRPSRSSMPPSAHPRPTRGTWKDVLNRPLTKAYGQRAATAAANRGEKFQHVFLKQTRNGKVHAIRVPDTEGLHRIKMEIDNAINGLKNRSETGLGNVQIVT